MESLTNIDIRKLPWPHIVAPNFLPKDLFENINSAIPNKEQTSTEENCIKYNMMYQTDPAFLDVLEMLADPQLISALYDQFDITPPPRAKMQSCRLVHAEPGFGLNAHTDLKDKPCINLQIYLSENEKYETVRVHNLQIGSTMTTEVPCQPNLMWAFVTSENTWHTLPITKTKRVSLLCKYGE